LWSDPNDPNQHPNYPNKPRFVSLGWFVD
jgi:hypothetical protein